MNNGKLVGPLVSVHRRVLFFLMCITFLIHTINLACISQKTSKIVFVRTWEGKPPQPHPTRAIDGAKLCCVQVRANRPAVDVIVIGKFIFVNAGLIGNVLFIIVYLSTVYWATLYKASDH